MTHPFEDESGTFVVLVNEEGQHSLWPVLIEVPSGWSVVHPADSRQACLDYVQEHWTDLRPLSLVRRTAGTTAATPQQAGHATVARTAARSSARSR